MKYILIVIMVSFAMCISTACSGLGNKTKKEDNKGMDTAFVGKHSLHLQEIIPWRCIMQE